MKILVTGGAGFIGSAVIRYLIKNTTHSILNIDKLTYASNLEALKDISDNSRYCFAKIDICHAVKLKDAFESFVPDVVMHLAAETHVDRSIDNSTQFIQTNIIGTHTLLEVARHYWLKLDEDSQKIFRLHHISTDEVYGDLEGTTDLFTEQTPYAPSSPYSASKASSDHLVRAWHRTFGLPIIVTNCSNNYGPYQFPEKLIPLVILNALKGKALPIYGTGNQVRDWLYVDDHASALHKVLMVGKIGETYNIGGHNEKKNIDVVKTVCRILDELHPQANGIKYELLIKHVTDRPGHDVRYAIDASKIQNNLGWIPKESFDSGIRKTVTWYLDNYQRENLGV